MIRALLIAVLILSIISPAFAIDEDSYIRFMEESVITMHRLLDNPNGMREWLEKMRGIYPGFMDEDWAAFEDRLKGNRVMRDRVINAILESVVSRGYDARVVDLGDGLYTVEIIE